MIVANRCNCFVTAAFVFGCVAKETVIVNNGISWLLRISDRRMTMSIMSKIKLITTNIAPLGDSIIVHPEMAGEHITN